MIAHRRKSTTWGSLGDSGRSCHRDDRREEAGLELLGRQARDAPSTLRPDAVARLQGAAGNAAVQRVLGGVPVQRLRSYAAVPMTRLVGPGKMLRPENGWHYTITKAEAPEDAYTNQFHVTFEQGAEAGHPHFYFSDLGGYQSTWESTQQNLNFKERKGGSAAFPKLKEKAKEHAAALLTRPDFPAYEGSSLKDIADRKAKAAAETAAAEALAASQKAKELAGVKTLKASVTTAKAKDKAAKFKAWLEEQAPGSTAAVRVAGPSALTAVLTFEDFAKASAGLPLVHRKIWNDKVVSAEMPDS